MSPTVSPRIATSHGYMPTDQRIAQAADVWAFRAWNTGMKQQNADRRRVEVTMNAVGPLIPYLIPILVLQLGLVIFALYDLSRRERVNGPKWVWALVILLGQLVGPILYFTIGRRDE
jgi:hypothetical protein